MKFEWEYELEIDELHKILLIYEKCIDAIKEEYTLNQVDKDIVCSVGKSLIELDDELGRLE